MVGPNRPNRAVMVHCRMAAAQPAAAAPPPPLPKATNLIRCPSHFIQGKGAARQKLQPLPMKIYQ